MANVPGIGSPKSSLVAAYTTPDLMEPYDATSVLEDRTRVETRLGHDGAITLWLRCFALHSAAFYRSYDLPQDGGPAVRDAFGIRLDLLGLAGSYSKLALDALLDGYYAPAYGQIRWLLELWRRCLYLELVPTEAVEHFRLPEESPVLPDGSTRRGRSVGPRTPKIEEAIEASADPDVLLVYNQVIKPGFTHMNAGAHPSAEGAAQVLVPGDVRRVFGPNYNADFARFGFVWGLSANLAILDRVRALGGHGAEWSEDLANLFPAATDWLSANQGPYGADR